MSAFGSVSSYSSAPANVPACDAWGLLNINFTSGRSETALEESTGISSVQRLSPGLSGISFSNPELFNSGAYVVIATPELLVDGQEIKGTSPVGYGPVSVVCDNGKTGGGFSGGVRIKTYTYPTGFHTGGGTAAQNDTATGTLRLNIAAFSFATDSDTGVPLAGNYIRGSENLENTNWGGAFGGAGTGYEILNTVSTNPFGGSNAAQVKANAGNISSSSNYSIITQSTSSVTWARGKPWTWSFWAKGVNGGEKIVVRGAAQTAYTLITLTNQWKRYSGTEISFNNTPTLSFGTVGGAGSDVAPSFYVWGFQHEPGSVSTNYVKTDSTAPVLGNQDARKRLVPGAGGYGADGNTYASTPYKNFDRRRAVAYGTIVIPPNKGNASPVSAYIENGFNVAGVSAGANSLFDISFLRPLMNEKYCVILSNEYETSNTTAQPSEFSLLVVRAGQNSRYKSGSGFRVECMRQNTADNSWTNQSSTYQSGLTERIHFMVFGEYTQGQSFLTNPYRSFLPTVGQNGQHPNLDYEVYGIHFYYQQLSATVRTASDALGYLQGKPSLVPFTSAYVGASAGYFNGILQPDLGITYITSNTLSTGNVQAWANTLKNVPQSRRAIEMRANSAFFPIKTSTQRERLVQYYAIRDGYTYTSTVHPSGVTNSGFTAAGTFQPVGLAYPAGTTFTGATFSASRRVLGLISDTQAQDFRVIMNEFFSRMGAAGATLGIIADDSENAPGTLSLYHLGTETRGTPIKSGKELLTNGGIFASAFVAGSDPDRAFAVSGMCADMLYDYYGISAGGSSSKTKLVNRMDPEELRYLVYDPRIHTYKFSPGGGPTSDSSPTIASRFMETYGNMCKRWNVGGTTATSITHAAEMLYAHGGAYTPTQNGGATFPYYATERASGALGYQARTMNDFNPYLIWFAWDQTVAELMYGHYRYIMYSDGISSGIQYSQYGTGNIDANNMEMGPDGNCTPLLAMSLTANNTINAPTIYGEILGAPNSTNMGVYSGFKPNPVTRAEKYCLNGRTYAVGNNYDYISSYGGVAYYVIPNGCKKFYPKTAVGEFGGSNPSYGGGSSTQYDRGSGYGRTGTIWTNLIGTTVESPIAAGATGFTAWGGFTALAGDYIWIQNANGVTNSTPLTVAENIGIVSAGTKRRIGVLESLASYGITGGLTFTIEHTTNNHSFAAFIFEMQRVRAQLRSTPEMLTRGFTPYICGYYGTTNTKWAVDHRYWFEMTYHLLVSGASYLYWFNFGTGIDGIVDGNSILIHRVLDEWRTISGNSVVRCVTTDPIQLDSEIITSGGRVLKGKLEGMHLWRISVRPGTLGFNESVFLTQNSRSDIPKTLVVKGGSIPEHTITSNPLCAYGTRGIWLITKSAVPPDYKISHTRFVV